MEKKDTFIVDSDSFKRDFLSIITKFKSNSEFLPIHVMDGKLVVFCQHTVKSNKGSIGLYVEFSPSSISLEEGSVFYVKDAPRLEKTIGLMSGERVVFTITSSHIKAESEKEKFGMRLYCPLLASKDRTFWNPRKFDIIRSNISEGIPIDSETLSKIQKTCNTITNDMASISYSDTKEKTYLTIGEKDQDSFKLEIPTVDGFSKQSKFTKYLFGVLGKSDIILSETNDKKIIVIQDKLENLNRFCFVTKFA